MPEISPVLNMLAPFARRPIMQLVTVNKMTSALLDKSQQLRQVTEDGGHAAGLRAQEF